LLKGLLNEPTFNVTVLQRASSRSNIPSSVPVISVADDYPQEELVKAFKGQDVVVNAVTSTSIAVQYRFIDAAIEAGVKRYVPSEYGLNNLNPAAQALPPVFRDKGEVQKYLRSNESTGLTWTAIACGMWITWSMEHNFLGLRVPERKVIFYDDGKGLFSCTTLENTALALTQVLLKPEETENKLLCISDFATSQAELLKTMERLSGEKWTSEAMASENAIRGAKERYEKGDLSAVYTLIEIGFTTGRYGGHLEEDGALQNEFLGLPKRALDDVVREGLELMKLPCSDA
jgi:hypothetical protein